MNIFNLVVLSLLMSIALYILQRTERKLIWLPVLVFFLPGMVIWRWAEYRGQVNEALIALGIAGTINVVFWLAWGRHHPPGSEGDITVFGQEQK